MVIGGRKSIDGGGSRQAGGIRGCRSRDGCRRRPRRGPAAARPTRAGRGAGAAPRASAAPASGRCRRATSSSAIDGVRRLGPVRDADPGQPARPLEQLPDRRRRDPVRAAAAAVLDDPVGRVELVDRRVHPDRAPARADPEAGAGADAGGLDPGQVEAGEEVVGERRAAGRGRRSPRTPPPWGRRSRSRRLPGPSRRESIPPGGTVSKVRQTRSESAAVWTGARYDHHKSPEGESIFTQYPPNEGSEASKRGRSRRRHLLLHRLRLPPLAARGGRPARLPRLRRLLLRPRLDLRVDAGARRRTTAEFAGRARGRLARLAGRGAGDAAGRRPLRSRSARTKARSRSSRSRRAGPGSGRSAAADLRLDDPSVSRRHALIVSEGPKALRVLDDRSLNGVHLNGELIEWARLVDGDELAIGRYRLFVARSLSSAPPDFRHRGP